MKSVKFQKQNLVIIVMLAIFFLMNLFSARHNSITYDEDAHYRYGMQILTLDSDRFDASKMPFSAFNALPGKLATLLPAGSLRMVLGEVTTGRAATLLFSMLLAFFTFRWSKALYGFVPALFTLLLYTFEPNIIAHSQLVTTDLYATGMITLSTYTLWRFSLKRDWKHAGLFAITLGLSQLGKYTSVFLYPLLGTMLLLRDVPALFRFISSKDTKGLWAYLRRMVQYGVFVGAVSILIINAGFLFNGSFTPLGDYEFKSAQFQSIQSKLSYLSRLPVPLPYPYLEGLDSVLQIERSGKGYGRIYLLGELSEDGFKGYYLYAFLYKVPIAIQLAVLLSAAVYAARRKRRRFLENELFLIGPVLFFTVYFNFFYQAQIGIRYLLVVFPFLHIFCGNLLRRWQAFGTGRWIAVGALAVYLIVSVLSYYPHYIPYFNELVMDRRLAYQVLADSNLDWGQSLWYVEQYQKQHPEVLIEPEEPTAGKIVVGINSLVGITEKPERYEWLREHFLPVGTIAYANLIYEITPEEINQLR